MNFAGQHFYFVGRQNRGDRRSSVIVTILKFNNVIALLLFFTVFQLAGCVSDEVDGGYGYTDKGAYPVRTTVIDEQGESVSKTSTIAIKKADEPGDLTSYQQTLAEQGPQKRADTEGRDTLKPLGLLKPAPGPEDTMPYIEIVTDPNTGKRSVSLTIEQAVARTLANSPEIRVVSFDPSIAKQDITKAASEFDITAFGRINFEEEDNPPNSIYQPGQSDVRTWESGIKQRGVTGSEWSLSYALTRSWDDLAYRPLPTRHEPILGFQLKQPLLRDAWQEFNLAGVNIARLNYRIALLGFREKAEDTAAQVISGYWRLLQARRDYEIYKALLDRTLETLNKVEGRKEIDATDVQIKQAEASAKAREAALLQASKAVIDAQDILIRLMTDAQLNMLDEFQIIPTSEASIEAEELDPSQIMEVAMQKNPVIQRTRIEAEIADINIRVARNQHLPRLDLVASTRAQGLARRPEDAHDQLYNGDFASYAIGLSLEYPLGNRRQGAELLQRRLERRKAISALQNVADEVAILAKEAIRKIEINHSEIQVQKDAVEAASIHLQALEDSEPIRERLTPEFLLVKLQAQEALANAQQSEIRAIVNFNISLAQMARISGTVLELHQVSSSLPVVLDNDVTGE